MPTSQVLLETKAKKEYLALSKTVQEEMIEAIENLSAQPRPQGCKKLINQEGYRIRKGNYRILYTIDDKSKKIFIYRIGHRREVYR